MTRLLARRGTALVPTLLMVLALVVLAPVLAQAQVLTIPDPRDRGQYRYDISAIKVTHGPRNLFVRTKTFSPVRYVNVAEAWIDTRAGNPGPEFLLYRNTFAPRHLAIVRVDRWHARDWRDRRCARAEVRIDRGDLLMKAPRRCLRIGGVTPQRVRVTVHTYDEQFVHSTEDWAPRERRFGARFVYSS
jgi:hypothetical protein